MYITLIILLHRDCVKKVLRIREDHKSGVVEKLKVMGHYDNFLKLKDKKVRFARTTSGSVLNTFDEKQMAEFETASPQPKKRKL